MSEYFGRLTEVGIAAEAWAKTHDAKVRLTHIAVGDGGGEVPVPSGSEKTNCSTFWPGSSMWTAMKPRTPRN